MVPERVSEVGTPKVRRGGKAVAVSQQDGQLQLPFATTESAPVSTDAATNSTGAGLPAIPRRVVSLTKDKEEVACPTPMDIPSASCLDSLGCSQDGGGREPAGAAGSTRETQRPEEPYVKSTSTVPWEGPLGNWGSLPYPRPERCEGTRRHGG